MDGQPSRNRRIVPLVRPRGSTSFGMQTVPVTGPIAQRAGVPERPYVTAVQAGGPSASVGIRIGDVITEVDGQPATSNDRLTELTITKEAGYTVPLTYVRSGQTHMTTVTLGSQPSAG
jgi:putative serine protease PepD